MVEGARLESVYTGNCIEGSNPSVSADYCFDYVNTNAMFRTLTVIFLIIIIGCKKKPVVTYTPKIYPVYSNPKIYKILGYRLFTVNGEINDLALISKYRQEFSQYFYNTNSIFNNPAITRFAEVADDSLWNLGTIPVGEMKRKNMAEYDRFESSQWTPVNDTNSFVLHVMKYKIFEKQQTSSGLWYLKAAFPYAICKRSTDTLFFPVTQFIIISRNSNSVSFSFDQFNNDIDPAGSKKLGPNDTLLLQRLDVALYKEK